MLLRIFILISLILSSCQSKLPNKDKPIKHEVLTYSNYGSHNQSENFIINSNNDFETAWQKAHDNIFPKPNIPPINFNKESVLLINFKPRNYGGYTIDLNHVKLIGNVCYLSFSEKNSNLDAPTLSVMTSPYVFVKVNKIQPEKIIVNFK